MIYPERIKAGDFFFHKNNKTYLFLGVKTTCLDAGIFCMHYKWGQDVSARSLTMNESGDISREPCNDIVYAFLIDSRFCWVSLKDREWKSQFKKLR